MSDWVNIAKEIVKTARLYNLNSDRCLTMNESDLLLWDGTAVYVNQQAYPNPPVTNTDPSYNSETKIDKQIAVEGLVIALHSYHTEYDITTACKLAPKLAGASQNTAIEMLKSTQETEYARP